MRELMRRRLSQAGHARMPDAIADLALGLNILGELCRDVELIPGDEIDKILKRGMNALVMLAERQESELRDADPVERFRSLLANALAGRRCHLCSETGGIPETPHAFGWNEHDGQGPMVGWGSKDIVCLLPEVAVKVCRDLTQGGEGWTISTRSLQKQLDQKGVLVETEKHGGRGTYTVRKTIAGARHAVLAVRRSWIFPTDCDQSDQPGRGEAGDEW